MSIRRRIFIPVIAVAVLAASAILISNIMQFSGYVTSILFQELYKVSAAVHSEIEILELKAQIAALYFSNDNTIITAMENGDIEGLSRRAAQLSGETGVGLSTITDALGRAIVRTHIQTDTVNAEPVSYIFMSPVRAALLGQSITSTENSIDVELVSTAGAPIYNYQGQLLGAVIVGFRLDTNEFVDRQKRVFNCEISILHGSIYVATTLFNEDGTRATGGRTRDSVIQTVLAGKTYSTQKQKSDRNILAVYTPIKNTSGITVGMLFAGHFLDEKTRMVHSFITRGIVITLSILLVSLPFIMFVVGRVSSPIITMINKAYYDALTGVYNRRYLDENLKSVLQSLSRSNGVLSVMMVDIDLFKKYNDTYGHKEGDNCLKIVAETLCRTVTRAADFVVRYGGEEFSVILPNTDEAGARTIAERLLQNIRNCNIPHKASDVADCVTISIGVAAGKVEHFQNPDDYIKLADKMLYESKQNGRNRYTFQSF